MGILDRLRLRLRQRAAGTARAGRGRAERERVEVERAERQQAAHHRAAVACYRYLVRTASPEAVEQAHVEAFVELTAEQRRQVLTGLGQAMPGATDWARSYDVHSLARIASLAEHRRPGSLEQAFGRSGHDGEGSLLASVAVAFLGTATADALLASDPEGSRFDEVSGPDTRPVGRPPG